MDLRGLRKPQSVEVAGEFYSVDVHQFRVWLEALYEPLPLLAVLPLSEARELNRRTYDPDDPVDTKDFVLGWREVLATATGLDWFVAERLMGALAADWPELAGRLLRDGIDPLTAPADQTLHALLALALDGQDAKGREKFLKTLHALPAPDAWSRQEKTRAGFSPEEQAAAFMAAASSRTTGVRAS